MPRVQRTQPANYSALLALRAKRGGPIRGAGIASTGGIQWCLRSRLFESALKPAAAGVQAVRSVTAFVRLRLASCLRVEPVISVLSVSSSSVHSSPVRRLTHQLGKAARSVCSRREARLPCQSRAKRSAESLPSYWSTARSLRKSSKGGIARRGAPSCQNVSIPRRRRRSARAKRSARPRPKRVGRKPQAALARKRR